MLRNLFILRNLLIKNLQFFWLICWECFVCLEFFSVLRECRLVTSGPEENSPGLKPPVSLSVPDKQTRECVLI